VRIAHSGGEYTLHLTAPEVVLLVSALADVTSTYRSDEDMKLRIGWRRDEVIAFTDRLADFYRETEGTAGA
jgi:hypothetical protein